MNKIGNIVTNGKQNVYSELFNVVKSYDNIINDLPTLIVGWEKAKSIIPNIDILNKQYGNVWWTFTKTERRCDYEEDIIDFYKFAITYVMGRIKYVYIDLINYRLSSIKKVIKFLENSSSKTIFLTRNNNFMFVYSKEYNTIFGISLTLCEYIGIPKKKVIKLVNNGEFIYTTSFINSDIRRIIGSNTHYILPLYEYFQK